MTFPFLTVRALSDTPAPFYCHEEPYEPVRPWIGRHIEWVHSQLVHPSVSRRIVAAIYVCTVVVVGIISIIGIIGVVSLYTRYRRVRVLRAFSEECQKVPKPTVPHVLIKSSTQSFNHVNEYIIESGILWTKPTGSDKSNWQPLFFEGCENGRKSLSLSVDGAWLFVLDDRREIHSKQILHEEWLGEQYYYSDLSFDPNTWTDCWRSRFLKCTPFRNPIRIPLNSFWAGSDRGVFNQQSSDRVASLYIVGESACARGVPFSIPGSTHEPFSLLSFSVSAGTPMVLGYSQSHAGGATVHRLRLYTQSSDSSWIEHPLPTASTPRVSVTQHITIVQTGQGEGAKELRIMGTDSRGVTGMYIKHLAGSGWGFIPLASAKLSDGVPYERFAAGPLQPSVMHGYLA